MQEINLTQETIRNDDVMTMIAERGLSPVIIGTKVYEVTRYQKTFYNLMGDGKTTHKVEFALTGADDKYWVLNRSYTNGEYIPVSMTGREMRRQGDVVKFKDDGQGSIVRVK